MTEPRASTRPFSMRLTPEDRARLTVEAKGTPLGSYIRAKVLGNPPLRLRNFGLPVEDRAALAKALALLGQSHLASNLNQLARLANLGALPVEAEMQTDLVRAVNAIRKIRALLLIALGMNSGGAP